MITKDLIGNIIHHLQPGMEEYSDNAQFHYWMDYACELDEIATVNNDDRSDQNTLINYLNNVISKELSLSPKHHACVDVASTIESLIPTFKGQFKYE